MPCLRRLRTSIAISMRAALRLNIFAESGTHLEIASYTMTSFGGLIWCSVQEWAKHPRLKIRRRRSDRSIESPGGFGRPLVLHFVARLVIGDGVRDLWMAVMKIEQRHVSWGCSGRLHIRVANCARLGESAFSRTPASTANNFIPHFITATDTG